MDKWKPVHFPYYLSIMNLLADTETSIITEKKKNQVIGIWFEIEIIWGGCLRSTL